MALVIRDWKANSAPLDSEGNYVVISGRQEGVISYLLTLLGIDVTTTLKVSATRVEYRASSLAGTEQRIIPLTSVSSTYYGYHKPWQAMVSAVAAGFFMSLVVLSAITKGDAAMGCICASVVLLACVGGGILYYFLNKRMTLGFIENSGVLSGISFKRSIIEAQNIDEVQARQVCDIVQVLIDAALKK
jgi:hypothetical protein